MKILLINISLRPESKVIYIPLGLAYIASAIKNQGYDFDLLDIDAYRYRDDYVDQYLKEHQYDIICMGCIVTGYKYIKDLAQRIKRINRRTTIIVGNSVASSIPDLLLTKTDADLAVIGEGDVTIVELLEALKNLRPLKNVAGIGYKENGKIMKTAPRPVIEDIDTIPFPDWDLFNMEKYIEACSKYGASEPLPLPRERIRAFTISTARGCPLRCSFCYHVFRAAKFRYISPSVLAKEIKRLKSKYNINYFIFHDDLSLVSKKHASEIARCFLQEKIDVFWAGSCRADLFNRESDIELAECLKAAGCVGLGYSLESASPEILKMMN
ncbi:MAG: B12-binding domain-containing radical SAM protein, partial [Candidatus Omnitrophota bacterium]